MQIVVKFNRASVMNANGVVLLPGVNLVDAEVWAEAAKHPIVKALYDEGVIEWDMGKEETGGVQVEVYLEEMKQPEAIKTVKETIDLAILEKWEKVEKRAQVKKAIAAQIKEVKAPAEIRERSLTEEEKAAKDGGKGSEDVLPPDFTNDAE